MLDFRIGRQCLILCVLPIASDAQLSRRCLLPTLRLRVLHPRSAPLSCSSHPEGFPLLHAPLSPHHTSVKTSRIHRNREDRQVGDETVQGFMSSTIPILLSWMQLLPERWLASPPMPYPASISVAASLTNQETSDRALIRQSLGRRLLMSGVHTKLWDTGYTSPCRQPRVSQVEWSPPSEQCLIATSSREHIPHHRFMVLRCSKLNLNWDILSFHAPHLLFPYSQHLARTRIDCYTSKHIPDDHGAPQR